MVRKDNQTVDCLLLPYSVGMIFFGAERVSEVFFSWDKRPAKIEKRKTQRPSTFR